MRKIILYLALKYEGDFNKILKAIEEHEPVSKEELKNVEKRINSKYVTIIDVEYPTCLKHIANPPFVLFYYGNINLLNGNNKVAVIGKRKFSSYGEQMCKKIVNELKAYNATIVSGLALGIDAIAHQISLNNKMNTVAVLGSGIDYCYPPSNIDIYNQIKEKGLIISEYPNKQIPEPKNFLVRNRIIAAVSEYIVVIESNFKSGTMNTVSYGLEYNKEICCVPFLANQESGCNHLIKQGAKLVEGAKDIYD